MKKETVIEVKDNTFEQEVENSDKPVFVDFFTENCSPCRVLAPVLETLAEEIPEVKFCKCNAITYSELQDRFGVMSVPNKNKDSLKESCLFVRTITNGGYDSENSNH
jgi:thioredoxin 1